MKTSNQQKVSKEELGKAIEDLQPWLESYNSLLEDWNNLTNKNIDEANTASEIIELDVSTGSAGITAANPIRFTPNVKSSPIGCTVLQCVIKQTFTPVEVAGCPAWEDVNGEIIIRSMAGLAVNTVYTIRFRII